MSKVTDLREAVKQIRSGDCVSFVGGVLRNKSIAVAREIIRQGIRNLHLQSFTSDLEADMLVGAGCVRRVESVYTGLMGYGLAPNFRRAVEAGEVEAVDLPESAFAAKFRARGMGVPFGVTASLNGTDVARNLKEAKEITCPFTGRKVVALPAANPDVAIIHAHRADTAGNLQFDEIRPLEYFENVLAAKKVIASVEEIVSVDYTYANPEKTVVPGVFVGAVVRAPWGTHPEALEGKYNLDSAHLKMYLEHARDSRRFKEYLDKYIYSVETHIEYLNLIGLPRLLELQSDGGV
jgi:glutaconate CoA-transferase subunit A